jgi:hypothetical protein
MGRQRERDGSAERLISGPLSARVQHSKCDGRLRDYATRLTMHIDTSLCRYILCTLQAYLLLLKANLRLAVLSARCSAIKSAHRVYGHGGLQ